MAMRDHQRENRMKAQQISYDVEGHRMVGHLAFDERRDGRRPGVLLCHEGPGLDAHVRSRADLLADLGYIAFALDYHGGGQPLPLEQIAERALALLHDRERMRMLGRAGLEVLCEQDMTDTDRLAAIGYCAGGTMALELARDGADLRAVVGFHCGLATSHPADGGSIAGSVLVCIGGDDPLVPQDERLAFEQEMHSAGVADWQVELYGGVGHSFTNPRAGDLGLPGVAFDARADARSWRSMLALFDETLISDTDRPAAPPADPPPAG